MLERFQGDFQDFFEFGSLGLEAGDTGRLADTVLWEAPRPVLRRAIPKLLQTLRVVGGRFLPGHRRGFACGPEAAADVHPGGDLR